MFPLAGLCKVRQGRRQLRQKCLDVRRPSPCYYKPNSQQRVAPPLPSEAPPQYRGDRQKHSLRMPAEQFLLLLLHAEPPPLSTRQKHSPPYTDVAVMTLLTNLADEELVHMIAWAKKLPGKGSTWPREDQKRRGLITSSMSIPLIY